MIIKCNAPNCNRTHADGFRLSRSSDGWRCQEHLHNAKDNRLIRRVKSLDRPLTGKEAQKS